MDFDTKKIEGELKKISPAKVSDRLLDRLDGAMKRAALIKPVNNELMSLEERLRALVPSHPSEDMISRLDEAMSRWHEKVPVEEKVVSIHPEAVKQGSFWSGLRAVAIVAFLGVAAAWLTGRSGTATIAANERRIPVLSQGGEVPTVFTSEDTQAAIVGASDHGLIWTTKGQPVRCTELHVRKRVQFVNEYGERLIIEQPERALRFTSVTFD